MEISASEEVPDIFFVACIDFSTVQIQNTEMTFCGKLNSGVHDQNVQIYCIYKFVIAYNRALIGFD